MTMKRLALPLLAATVAALAYLLLAPRHAGPNVLLVSIDTLRADHLRPYGYSEDTAPFLSAIAREGTLFRNTIAQANWTLPSHVSMLTSLFPPVHGVREGTQRMGPPLRPLASMLREAGYATSAFVDGGVLSRKFGFDLGFDLYDDRSKGGEKDRKAVSWMAARRRRPFFLFYHTYDAHYPYRHHPRPRDFERDPRVEELAKAVNRGETRFSDEQYELGILAWYTEPRFYKRIAPGRMAPLKKDLDRFVRERWPKMSSYAESLRYLIGAYDGGISFADARLRELWGEMRDAGLDADTVLVVTSDHGECFLEHGELGHPAVLYDEIVRVPLLIRYPGLGKAGRPVPEQVMSVDILPTILDLAGVPVPPGIQGRSLLPLAGGTGAEEARPAFADSLEGNTVRTPGWKYIEAAGGGGAGTSSAAAGELYDLVRDLGEKNNLAVTDASRRAAMEETLRAWRAGNARLSRELGLDRAAPGRAELDPATLNELRALGYMQ